MGSSLLFQQPVSAGHSTRLEVAPVVSAPARVLASAEFAEPVTIGGRAANLRFARELFRR
jgi:hypothetical protein